MLHQKNLFGRILLFFIAPILICITTFLIYPLGMSVYHRKDIVQIERRVCEFDTLLNQREFEKAYEYMSPSYRQSKTSAEFQYHRGFSTPPCPDRDWSIQVSGNNGSVSLMERTDIFIWVGIKYKMIKENGEWYFTGESELYWD